jgi:death-on-curing family protein
MSTNRIPDSQYVKALHEAIFHEFRDSEDPVGIPGIKSIEMLESACMRPHTSLGSVEKYKSTLEKLAALFYSLVMNHPFHDGNKRTALASLISGMSLNKRYFKPETTDESIFRMVVSVAKNDFPHGHGHQRPHADFVVSELYSWLRANTAQRSISAPTIPINKFLSIVREAGGRTKQAGSKYLVFNNNDSISISTKTQRLNGEVVKKYLSKLGISESRTAIMLEERLDGLSPEKKEIRKYKKVLTLLAEYDRQQEG